MNDDKTGGYGASQDGVMQDYERSKAFRGREDKGNLHMFFSPFRVPSGLTDEEILICLALYPLKKAWADRSFEERRKRYLPHMPEGEVYPPEILAGFLAAGRPVSLPRELTGPVMTREAFQTGIYKLAQEMLVA